MKIFFLLAVLAASMVAIPNSWASYECSAAFQRRLNGFEQWLQWEQTANIPPYRQTQQAVAFSVSEIPRERVEVWTHPNANIDSLSVFFKGSTVIWPKHAFNRSRDIPFWNEPNLPNQIDVRLTASRSVVPTGHSKLSFKLPTDHVHGVDGELQLNKTDNRQEIAAVPIRWKHIAEVDATMPRDPYILLLPDIMAVSDPATGNGFLVRDLSALHSGHYYLPAFAIPYVGAEIARRNGQGFDSFWQKAFAEALGRAKAELTLHYALEMETPNPQNILIELNSDFSPTGRIVFRDIADTVPVVAVARAFGFNELLESDRQAGFELQMGLHPYWSNSIWQFHRNDSSLVSFETAQIWENAHDEMYLRTIESAVGKTVPRAGSLQRIRNFFLAPRTEIDAMGEFLHSGPGQDALKKYRERLRLGLR